MPFYVNYIFHAVKQKLYKCKCGKSIEISMKNMHTHVITDLTNTSSNLYSFVLLLFRNKCGDICCVLVIQCILFVCGSYWVAKVGSAV